MSFFDDSHVTDVGLEGSAGPSVGIWESVVQGLEQQFRVDSQQALEKEIQNRWLENLQRYEQKTGQTLDVPDFEMGVASYQRYLDNIEGKELGFFDQFDLATKAGAERLNKADMAIRQLRDPELRSFEQVVQEVYAMQREVEQRSADMASRAGAGATVGNFAGAMAGSFSFRDPVNVISLPIGGVGRTVAMRIATEMGVAGAVTAATEAAFVQPNRERAGLPERSLAFDVAAAMAGAGFIRGGIEGIGAGVRRLRQGAQPTIDLDFEDDMLRQMFTNNANSPRARAGEAALDDIQFVERNNPYGAGEAANARFLAELQDVQRVMGGAPDTAIARVLPPVPFEYIRNAADFQIVKEQAPKVWTRLEEAQARVVELDERITATTTRLKEATIVDAVRLVDENAATQLEQLAVRVNDETVPEPERVAADIEAQAIIQRVGPERLAKAFGEEETRTKHEVRRLRASRRAANRQYREAYKAVEHEAGQIRALQTALRSKEQDKAIDLLSNTMGGRTFIGSALTHNMVERQMVRIAELAETQDDRAAALFREREDFGEAAEGETKPLAYETADGRIDIGLAEPVDPEFKLITEDGEFTVRQIMDDLTDDERLDEAMRTCLL